MQKNIPIIDEILRILDKHRVEFIVVGGVCAVLHGAPVSTFDVDIVHARTIENIERLMAALNEMDAYYRGHPKRLKPDSEYLASSGHHLLMTCFGPLDVLGTIENQAGYDNLLEFSEEILLEDMKFRILSLDYLVKIKQESFRQKDRLKIQILEHTLKEKSQI